MAQKGFISQIDNAIANLVWGYIENDSQAKAIISSREQISFSSPKSSSTRRNKKLFFFLYNITQEPSSRNLSSQEDLPEKLAHFSSLTLHYLVTAFTRNEENDHLLLEKIIQTLLVEPLSAPDPKNNVKISVKIDSLSLDELSRLWATIDAPLRFSISLAVSNTESQQNFATATTSEKVISQTPTFDSNIIIQLYQNVVKTFTEQSTAWRSRNMVVKQWVLQDFQKNSGMTAEEMKSVLNNLGNKLEHNQSATQFIKPLSHLAEYYQHQLDELKGLHRISHKQADNIETITSWIKDVKALIGALTK